MFKNEKTLNTNEQCKTGTKKYADAIRKIHMDRRSEPEGREADMVQAMADTDYTEGAAPKNGWLVKNWLPRGELTVLLGRPGVHKTLLAQQLATAAATGVDFLKYRIERSRVYGVMREDSYHDVWSRQIGLNEHYEIDMHNLKNIKYLPLMEEDCVLIDFAGTGRATEFYEELYTDIIRHTPDLIILDGAHHLFEGDETDSYQVQQFMELCNSMARSGRSAVLMCLHYDADPLRGYRPEWYSYANSAWYLRKHRLTDEGTGSYIMTRLKSEYAKCGEEMTLDYSSAAFSLVKTTAAKQ